MPVTGGAVTLILATIDRSKTILDGPEELKLEPPGDDADLISQLAEMAGAAQMQLVQLTPGGDQRRPLKRVPASLR